MTHRYPRGRGGERGASLILALSFIVFFAIVVTAVLDFAITSQNSATVVQNRTKASFAAKAALDSAITRIRNDPDMLLGKSGGADCGLTYSSPGVPDTVVTCTPTANSGASRPGVDGPANAILTMDPARNVTVNGAGRLRATGNVFSNGGITLGTGNPILDARDAGITAKGSCTSAAVTQWLAAVPPLCNAPGTAPQIADGNDPLYGSRVGEVLVNGKLPKAFNNDGKSTGWSCVLVGTNRYITINPGQYFTDPTKLEYTKWFTDAKKYEPKCGKGNRPVANVIVFRPGAYYFSLNKGDKVWNIKNGIRIIAGNLKSGTLAPIPTDGTTAPVNCDNSAAGVQMVLGGASKITVDDGGSLEICAGSGTPDQQIAIYGVTGNTELAASVVMLRPSIVGTSAADCLARKTGEVAGSTGWTNPQGLIPANAAADLDPDAPVFDDSIASRTIAPGQDFSIWACGFAWEDPEDGTSLVDIEPENGILGVQLRSRHNEVYTTTNDVEQLYWELSVPVLKADLVGKETKKCKWEINKAPKESPPGTPPYLTPTIQPIDSPDVYDCAGDLLDGKYTREDDPDTPENDGTLSGMTLQLRVKNRGTSPAPIQTLMDGLEVRFEYGNTIRQQNICVSAPSNCNALNVGPSGSNPNTTAFVWGTIYTPLSDLAVNFRNVPRSVFANGTVTRALTVNAPPPDTGGNADSLGRFRLGGGTGRGMQLVATQNGTKVGRAVVRIVDSATADPHGYAVAVREWNTAR
jgi:Tfp pilus assembly protein PilX